MKRRRLIFELVLFLSLLGLGLTVLTYFYVKVYTARPKLKDGKVCQAELAVITVNPGEGLATVARRLKEQDVITDERLFMIVGRLMNADTRIQVGEYEFMKGTPMRDVLSTLVLGKQKYYKLPLIPGFNIWQVAAQLNLNLIWSGSRFLSLCRDPVFIAKLGIPADSLEGYLYPDTYQFRRFDSEEFIIRAMVRRFEEQWKPEYEKRAQELSLSRHQVITMASIIEKEAGLREERPLVSAVIYNRLRKKMGLFMDPTVIYGLMPNFDGNLTKSDLAQWTPYNTYKIQGLPPGPICSPSDSSIRAALWPADVSYLYFVAKGDGSHNFSSRYEDHLKAVAEYQEQLQLLEPGSTAEPAPAESPGQTISPEP